MKINIRKERVRLGILDVKANRHVGERGKFARAKSGSVLRSERGHPRHEGAKVFDQFRFPLPESALDIAAQFRDFESFGEAKRRREVRVSLLQNGEADEKAVAHMLAKCRRKRRCRSPACPVCARRFRRWLVGALLMAFPSLVSVEPDEP